MGNTLIPAGAMQVDEAMDIYNKIVQATDFTDDDIVYLLKNIKQTAVRYANIRSGWDFKSSQEKMDADDARTATHDGFIAKLNMMARAQGEAGEEWQRKLGTDDRKRIGDFACYIALFLALDAR